MESLESSSPTLQRTPVVPQPGLAERTVALPWPLTCCINLSQPQLSALLAACLSSPLACRRTAKLTLLTASEALVKEGLRDSARCVQLNCSLRQALFPAFREGGEHLNAWSRQRIYSLILKRTTVTTERHKGKFHSSFNPNGSIVAKQQLEQAVNTCTFPPAILRHLWFYCSEFQRTTDWFRIEGTSGGPLV